MSPENKQRIVGVVVLIAFIALLVPFLFTSGVKKRNKLDIEDGAASTIDIAAMADNSAQTETVAVNVQTADSLPVVGGDQQVPVALPELAKDGTNVALSNDLHQQAISVDQSAIQPLPQGQAQPTDVSPVAGAQVLPSVAEPELAKPAVGSMPVTETLPSSAPVNVASNVTDGSPVVTRPTKAVAVAKSKKRTGKKLVAKKSKNKANGKNKKLAHGLAASWSVQVGSFSDQARMQKFVDKLQAQGFNVYLQKIDTSRGEMVRVLVGRETNRQQAAKVASRLKTTLKIKGNVVGNKN